MLRKLAAAFVALPLGILLVAFAVANRHAVTVSFDPSGSGIAGLTATVPLFLLILVVLAAGIVAGGTATWFKQRKWRRSTRRLAAEVRDLRHECATLRAEVAQARSALPAPTREPV